MLPKATYGLFFMGAAALTACAMSPDAEMPGNNMGMSSTEASENATTFAVRIEDVSSKSTLQSSAGPLPVPLSPGVYAVHSSQTMPIFTADQADRRQGLEALAEDGSPMQLAASLKKGASIRSSGAFSKPVGMNKDAPLMPGDAYSFDIQAKPGDRLSFATMFVQSNDLFLAPDDAGVALFDANNRPVSGDVTSQVMLWDAGTEVNEEPGVGPNTKPKQGEKAKDVGIKENRPVQQVNKVGDGFNYPAAGKVIRVTITPRT